MSLPSVTVIIPTYNRRSLLQLTLESLRAQDYEGDFEGVLVDDGSDDSTGELARAAGALVHRQHPSRGAGGARNAGLDLARAPPGADRRGHLPGYFH